VERWEEPAWFDILRKGLRLAMGKLPAWRVRAYRAASAGKEAG
jgi:hypothetical protein